MTRWVSVQSAAELLGLTPGALRKILERNARRGQDGGIEAALDGVRARKLGRLWRVTLSAVWSDPKLADSAGVKHSRSSSQNMRDGRGDRS